MWRSVLVGLTTAIALVVWTLASVAGGVALGRWYEHAAVASGATTAPTVLTTRQRDDRFKAEHPCWPLPSELDEWTRLGLMDHLSLDGKC